MRRRDGDLVRAPAAIGIGISVISGKHLAAIMWCAR
jgi:hypothetical protein